MYFMAGLGANGGRMLVRYWVAETLGETVRNVRDWYADLQVVNPFTNEMAERPGFGNCYTRSIGEANHWPTVPLRSYDARYKADRNRSATE